MNPSLTLKGGDQLECGTTTSWAELIDKGHVIAHHWLVILQSVAQCNASDSCSEALGVDVQIDINSIGYCKICIRPIPVVGSTSITS